MHRELGYVGGRGSCDQVVLAALGAFFLAIVAAIAVLAALLAYGAERRESVASFPEVVRL